MNQIKVLIVDDAHFIRDHVSRTVNLNFPEYHIDAAEDGDAGRNLMRKEKYDLILCDWEMPGLSGLELLQWARQQNHYRDIPFIMVTSRGERSYVLQAIQAGVNDYLGKPFEEMQLIEKVRKFIGKRVESSADSRRKAAQLLAAGNNAGLQKKLNQKPKGLAQLRVSGGLLKCAIKDITLQTVKVIVKRVNVIPRVFEQTVVDIDNGRGGSLAQMNGFISGLSATTKCIDSAYITLDVQFVDNDPEKLEVLTTYISKMEKKTHK